MHLERSGYGDLAFGHVRDISRNGQHTAAQRINSDSQRGTVAVHQYRHGATCQQSAGRRRPYARGSASDENHLPKQRAVAVRASVRFGQDKRMDRSHALCDHQIHNRQGNHGGNRAADLPDT